MKVELDRQGDQGKGHGQEDEANKTRPDGEGPFNHPLNSLPLHRLGHRGTYSSIASRPVFGLLHSTQGYQAIISLPAQCTGSTSPSAQRWRDTPPHTPGRGDPSPCAPLLASEIA